MVLLICLLIILIIWFWLFRKQPKASVNFPKSWDQILKDKVGYYRNLQPDAQIEFQNHIMDFLSKVSIKGVQTEIGIDEKLLVAASAIIPVMGFSHWEYRFLNEVLIYPDLFTSDYTISPGATVSGMVGSGPMEGKMILSKKSLHLGFSNDRDKKNVGIHEFIHLLDKADGTIDGVPEWWWDHSYSLPWINMMDQKMREIQREGSDISGYGATNRQEFFAVASEYFFERPHLLERKHPRLYSMLGRIFQQDPQKLIPENASQRKTISRNELCPCNSGKKFKKCCSNR